MNYKDSAASIKSAHYTLQCTGAVDARRTQDCTLLLIMWYSFDLLEYNIGVWS